jgi:hypothetical protein
MAAGRRISHHRRSRWLRETAQRLETTTGRVDPAADRRRQADRERQRRRRQLARAGYRVAIVEVGPQEEELLRSLNCLHPWNDADNSRALGVAVKLLLTQLVAKST